MVTATEQQFKQLYTDFYAPLCYFAFNIVGEQSEAEDIVEDVFLKLLQNKRTFSAEENSRAYLYTSTKNSCLNHLKTSTRVKERQLRFNSGLPEEEEAWVNELIKAEVLREVMNEIGKLPGHTGRIIEMSFFQELKNEEIAEALGISEKTVKNLKSSGLKTLKSCLNPNIFGLFILMFARP